LFSKEFDELKKRITQEAEIGRNPADQHVGAEEYAGGQHWMQQGVLRVTKTLQESLKRKRTQKERYRSVKKCKCK
jgi:nuclear transport factor 2 (NTF2) superfamily protein